MHAHVCSATMGSCESVHAAHMHAGNTSRPRHAMTARATCMHVVTHARADLKRARAIERHVQSCNKWTDHQNMHFNVACINVAMQPAVRAGTRVSMAACMSDRCARMQVLVHNSFQTLGAMRSCFHARHFKFHACHGQCWG